MFPVSMEGITSQPVRFIIGPDKKNFFVHSKIIAAMSPALEVLVQGDMREAIEGVVECKDVDEDTFLRFSQFAYTGNYETLHPTPLEASDDEHENDPSSGEQENDPSTVEQENYASSVELETNSSADYGIWAVDRKKKKKKKRAVSVYSVEEDIRSSTKQEELWFRFRQRTYDPGPAGIYMVERNTSAQECFVDVFLAHARVYVFADCYGVAPLEDLSLHKLHQTLCVFKMYEERTGDIVGLISFAYKQDTPDALRQVIAHFAACHMEKLWEHQDFQDLYAGELAQDMAPHLLRRLD